MTTWSYILLGFYLVGLHEFYEILIMKKKKIRVKENVKKSSFRRCPSRPGRSPDSYYRSDNYYEAIQHWPEGSSAILVTPLHATMVKWLHTMGAIGRRNFYCSWLSFEKLNFSEI